MASTASWPRRALTNLVGNGVATIVVSRWENELDMDRMAQVLNNETGEEAEEPEMLLPDPEPLLEEA